MSEALRELISGLAPDAVIHCGDFTDGIVEENIGFACGIMDSLGCPWFAVPGNHDTHMAASRAMFRERFAKDNGSWSFRHDIGGLRFFFLDVVWWIADDSSMSPYFDRTRHERGEITGMGPCPEDLDWLDRELAATEMPSLIVTHAPVHYKEGYPLATLPYGETADTATTRPEDFVSGFMRRDEGRQRMLDIVRNHKNAVACLAGHWHLNDALIENGRLFLQTASLREWPYEIRMIDYDNGTFDISTHTLDLPELRKYSFVEEWGNSWVSGDESVRNFSFTPDYNIIQ